MKLFKYVLSLFLITSLLVGCEQDSAKKKEILDVKITGMVTFNRENNRVFVAGKSNLESGSILTLTIDGEEFQQEVKVQPNGDFRTFFTRDNRNEAQLVVTLDPRKQSEELKKKYGTNGEYITAKIVDTEKTGEVPTNIFVEYEKDGKKYKVIESYAWLNIANNDFYGIKGDPDIVIFGERNK